MVPATDIETRESQQRPRSTGHSIPPELLLVERALKYCPVPEIPPPFIPYSYIPVSRELVVWWYFFHYIAFLHRPLDFALRTIPPLALALLVAVSYALFIRFRDSVFRLFRRRLRVVLRILALAGYTTQTITNFLDAANKADKLDCILIVALPALLIVVWNRNWPLSPSPSLRHWLRGLVGPITRKKAPYLANWGSQALCFVLAARRSPEEYLVGIPVQFILWCSVLLDSGPDPLADYRRRQALGSDANTRNPAARIPPEVQLQIFHLARTSLCFGADERPWDSSAYHQHYPVSGLLFVRPGLGATCSVCRAWRAAATEVLFTDIVLDRAPNTVALSRVLSAKPALARFVRTIAFAKEAVWAPRAMEDIVRLCAGATQLSFRRTHTAVLDVPGLTSAALHLRSLDIAGGQDDAAPAGTYRLREFDVASVLSIFPRLESLALRRYAVQLAHEDLLPEATPALDRLRALRLDGCSLQFAMLELLLRTLPGVRTVELRNMSAAGRALDVDILFYAQSASLRELLLASTYRNTPTASLIDLSGICELSALRSLAVNAHQLSQLLRLPPALEHLAVSFSPYSAWQNASESAGRRSALAAVQAICSLATSAPALGSVRLTDEVFLTQIPAWKVAAFLLRETLAPARIEVQVNLHLHWEDLRWYRVRLHLERRLFGFLNW